MTLLLERCEGSLEPELQLQVEAHLGACPDCQAFADTYAATRDLVARALARPLPGPVRVALNLALERRLAGAL